MNMRTLLAASVLSALSAYAAERPNILFILSDDHAAHAISAYGSKVNQTPNIDRIGREGVRFANCFCVNSICSPSRASILTGVWSHRNGVTEWQALDQNRQPTLPRLLHDAGYYTTIIGKWHLTSNPVGFDKWMVAVGQGTYYNSAMITPEGKTTMKGYFTDTMTDIAIQWLNERPKDKPFCAFVHNKAPHRNWVPKPELAAKWRAKTIPEPETFNDDYSTRCKAASVAEMRVDKHLTPNDLKVKPDSDEWKKADKAWKYQRYMQDYLACVESVDDNVGRLLDYLDKTGLSSNTIVVYASDQGFFLGDHDWFDKRFMYEESLRMPLLVRFPGAPKSGLVNTSMVLNVDFAPTLLECAGLKAPPEMQGRSFAAMLKGEPVKDWRTAMYYRYYNHPAEHNVNKHYGIRTERYKLIYFHELDAWELYDLQKDPHELHNVYADPAYADTVATLKKQLADLRTELGDTK